MMNDAEFQGFVVAKLDALEKRTDEINDRIYQILSGSYTVSAPRSGGGLVSLLNKIFVRW